MGRCCRGTRAHDRLERHALGASLTKAALDPPGKLGLRTPAEALARQRAEHLVRERARATHRCELVGVLHRTEALDETGRGLCVHTDLDELPVERVREVLLLEPDPPARQELPDRGDEPARDLGHLYAVRRRARFA
jgi:hypothetical protein